MARVSSPFSPRTLLGVLLVGAAALLVLLYALGAGLDGRQDNDGGAHAAGNGLVGFAALARMLEAEGFDVALSRSEGRLDEEALLVLTPQLFTDPDTLNEIIERRRYVGPTLVILPKWPALPAQQLRLPGAKPGWVMLGRAMEPEWFDELDGMAAVKPQVAPAARWEGLGLSVAAPAPQQVLSLQGNVLVPLVRSGNRPLAALWQDDGYYPFIAESIGSAAEERDDSDTEKWAVIFVAEPDLMNNYGFADQDRARLALALIKVAMEGEDLPVVFDLTVPGLGRSENLLTLAFEPPFLAATLCLILAALVVGWRAFRRFGPPAAEAAATRTGKRQLALNGAALVQRVRRWHLLGEPYAALLSARIARRLALRPGEDAPLMAALDRRGLATDYAHNLGLLRRAAGPTDLLRAAAALRSIERTLNP